MDEVTLLLDPLAQARHSLEQRLREAYFRHRAVMGRALSRTPRDPSKNVPELDGGVDRFGNRKKSVWTKIVDTMLQHQRIDPEGYIAAQFSTGRLPMASDLCGPRAWDRYEHFNKESRETVRGCLGSDITMFRLGVSETSTLMPGASQEEVWQNVLRNPVFMISALFRYGIAMAEGYQDIASELHAAALDEYLSHPEAYDEVWKGKIPEQIRRAAAMLLSLAYPGG